MQTLLIPAGATSGTVPTTDTFSARNALWVHDQAGYLRSQLTAALRHPDDDAVRRFARRHLPPCCADVDRGWFDQFQDSITAVQARIKLGAVPFPDTIAEEVALSAILAVCESGEGSPLPPQQDPWYTSLPAHDDDFDVDALRALLLEEDLSTLFEPDPRLDEDLQPAAWFTPLR